MKLIHLTLATLLLGGCASLGPKFESREAFNKKNALVYVYRVKRFAGGAASPYVCLDGQVVGEIPNGGYFPTEISPGNHKVELKAAGHISGRVHFNLEKNNTYFLRVDYSLNNQALEDSNTARQAALGPGGGGAIGGAMSAAFYGSSKEVQAVVSAIDTRAHKSTPNPGLLFVNAGYAQPEITETQLFAVPSYDKNPCAPAKKN